MGTQCELGHSKKIILPIGLNQNFRINTIKPKIKLIYSESFFSKNSDSVLWDHLFFGYPLEFNPLI